MNTDTDTDTKTKRGPTLAQQLRTDLDRELAWRRRVQGVAQGLLPMRRVATSEDISRAFNALIQALGAE